MLSEKIDEVRKHWARKTIDVGFCEDASQFFPINECVEFVAEVDYPYVTRYIRMIDVYEETELHESLMITNDEGQSK